MGELKPCPFCGRSKYVRQVEDDAYGMEEVVCDATGFKGNADRGCGASTGLQDTPEQAITAWNTRAEPAGTVITEDKATWPDDGRDVVYRKVDAYAGGYLCLLIAYDIAAKYFVERNQGCIWWYADQFKAPEQPNG